MGGTPGLDDPHAVARFTNGMPGRVRHQDGHLVATRRLGFGQRLDMILDTADDGRIIFVDVQDTQIGLLVRPDYTNGRVEYAERNIYAYHRSFFRMAP